MQKFTTSILSLILVFVLTGLAMPGEIEIQRIGPPALAQRQHKSPLIYDRSAGFFYSLYIFLRMCLAIWQLDCYCFLSLSVSSSTKGGNGTSG